MSDNTTTAPNPSQPDPARVQLYLFAKLNALQMVVAALVRSHNDLPHFIHTLERAKFAAETEHLFDGIDETVMALYSRELDEMLELARDGLQTPAAKADAHQPDPKP